MAGASHSGSGRRLRLSITLAVTVVGWLTRSLCLCFRLSIIICPPPSPTPPPTTNASKKDLNEIEVVDVVSQGTKTTVKLMSDEELYALNHNYEEKMVGGLELRARMNKIQATCV